MGRPLAKEEGFASYSLCSFDLIVFTKSLGTFRSRLPRNTRASPKPASPRGAGSLETCTVRGDPSNVRPGPACIARSRASEVR